MPRFAANLTMMFTELPFLSRFTAASDAGFDAVEFLFPYDHDAGELADLLQQNGLTLALFNLPPGNWAAGERGLAALPDRKADFRASVTTALTYAKALNSDRLHVMSGIADRTNPNARRSYREALAYLCDAAGAEGRLVMIEPINPRDMPGYFLDDFTFATDLIAELAFPNLKLQFDIYHRQILHGDVLTGLRTLMPVIGHMQIAAVPLRHEPGTGELDDIRILRAVDTLGYAGFVGCEYRPQADTRAGLGWLSNFRA
jgi:2-dehydrotetronate isomerase